MLTSDVKEAQTPDLGYHAPVNSLEGLTDTMLLLRFDPQRQKLTMLSIPRDTRTDIEGYGEKKINEANALGGPALTAETVSHLLDGVAIDRYIRINVQGVEKLIDALGGVTVYVPKYPVRWILAMNQDVYQFSLIPVYLSILKGFEYPYK